MLKLYDSNKRFIQNISGYSGLKIESELSNGDKTLSFTYRGKPSDIENEMYIQTEKDRFVVKEICPGDHSTELVCKLDLEELEADMFQSFTAEDRTAKEAADLAVAGTHWTVVSGMTKKRSVRQFKKTPYDILLKIRDAFMCEIRFDNLKQIIYLEEEFGDDRGVYLRNELNLKSVNLTLDSYDYYTRIIPIGADGIGISVVNGGKSYVENYQYSNKIRTLIWEDSSYEDPQALMEDAEGKLEDLSKPKRSYSAEVRDLAKLSGKYSLFSFGLGDTVTTVDEPLGIKDKQRIVKLTEFPDEPQNNTVELSNTVLSWEELQEKLDAAADAWDDISNADGTVNGVYVHGIQAGDVVGITAEINNTIEGNDTISGMKVSIKDNSDSISENATAIAGIDADLALVRARVGNLEATTITAAEADLKYADIQLANIDVAHVNKEVVKELFTEVGLIREAVISEGHITGFLDSVKINAASIVAGILDASIIQVTNLNADNINVGTLNGQRIANGAIDASKLSEELSETIDNTISDVQVYYALSPSPWIPPEDGWDTEAPTWQEGWYMWQKTVKTHSDGSADESDITCISGASGQKGEDAAVLRIDSSRGNVFKNNMVSTVLTAAVYIGGERITNITDLRERFGASAHLQWYWQKLDESTFGVIVASDKKLSDNGFSLTLTPDEVDTKVTFMCELITE